MYLSLVRIPEYIYLIKQKKIIKTLLAMPFIERTNTRIVLTTVKEDFRLI